MDTLPKIFIALGSLLVATGIVLWLLKGKVGLDWFGHLPGDFNIEREHFRLYAPLASMLVVSLMINLLLRLYRFLF